MWHFSDCWRREAPIRVVLADDHAMVREALAQILQESGFIRVVGQASDGWKDAADGHPAPR